jgi:cytochrome P450
MLYAGHLTIPSTLCAFWRDLAGTSSGPIVAAEADRLGDDAQSPALSRSYCLAALKESMRLHPAAPILYREVDASFELAGFAFARDTAVWVSPRLLHVDARYFSEPHRFLPERFMKGGPGPASASVYLPFGAGPRACVGGHMALQQMTLIALMAARRFTPEWISERLDGNGNDSYYLTDPVVEA